MTHENFTSPDSLDTVDVKGDNIEDGVIENRIKNQAKEYINLQLSQGLEGVKLQCLIDDISGLLQQQNIDRVNLNDKFNHLKNNICGEIQFQSQTIKNELINKYSSEYKELGGDVVKFLDEAFSNDFNDELEDFNINKFNLKDNIEGFSKYELDNFSQTLDKVFNQMKIASSFEDFKKIYENTNEEPEFWSSKFDIFSANALDFQGYLLSEGDKHYTDNLHNYSEEELFKMREEEFSTDNLGNFVTLLGLELGEGLEDILKFVGNILSGLTLSTRYWVNRSEMVDGISNLNSVKAEIENDMLLKENPSLMLFELLGEKGIQVMKQLASSITSGKNGDIVTIITSLLGLLVGGLGLAKLGTNLTRKAAVKSARKSSKNGTASQGRVFRNNLRDKAKKIGNVQKSIDKVDDIIGGAGLGHLTGGFSNKENKNFINENLQKVNEEVYNHPKTDTEVAQKLLSGEKVRLYHSHSSSDGVVESMMRDGMKPRRANESFFSTMPPVEGDTVNTSLYVDISDKKFFDATGINYSNRPRIAELIEQGYDGMIGESTSSLATSNLEVTLFKGEELGGKLHKFQESAAMTRIHQQLEDIFKLNRLYGDQMDFSLDQQNIIFGSIREIINSGETFSDVNVSKISEEFQNIGIPEDKVKKIIKILEKQANRLDISTEQVYKNAGLNKKDRIAAAIDLLEVDNFSPAQKDALMKAHEVGGYDSGVFHYTKKERIEKARILTKEGDFNRVQAEDLLDSGLAGKITSGDIQYNMNTSRLPSLDKFKSTQSHFNEIVNDAEMYDNTIGKTELEHISNTLLNMLNNNQLGFPAVVRELTMNLNIARIPKGELQDIISCFMDNTPQLEEFYMYIIKQSEHDYKVLGGNKVDTIDTGKQVTSISDIQGLEKILETKKIQIDLNFSNDLHRMIEIVKKGDEYMLVLYNNGLKDKIDGLKRPRRNNSLEELLKEGMQLVHQSYGSLNNINIRN